MASTCRAEKTNVVTEKAPPTTTESRVAEKAAATVVESTAVLTRQRYVTFVILLLTA